MPQDIFDKLDELDKQQSITDALGKKQGSTKLVKKERVLSQYFPETESVESIRSAMKEPIAGLGMMMQPQIGIPVKAAQMIGKIPGVGGGLSELANYLGRTAGSTAISSGMTEHPTENLKTAGTYAAIGEALPLGMRVTGKVAEALNPVQYTKDLMGKIFANTAKSEQEIGQKYNQSMAGLKNMPLYKFNLSNKYLNIPKSFYKDHYNSDIQLLHDDFMKRPSLQKAHDLQSQIGEEIRSIDVPKPDAATRKTIVALRRARNALNDDIKGFYSYRNPNKGNLYQEARTRFEKEVGPTRVGKIMPQIASGAITDLQPKKLQDVLALLSQKGKIKGHYLENMYRGLSEKIGKGKALSNILSLGGGALAGGTLFPGVPGTLAGGLAGPILQKFLGSPALELAQNPQFIQRLKRIEDPYRKAMQTYIGGNI